MKFELSRENLIKLYVGNIFVRDKKHGDITALLDKMKDLSDDKLFYLATREGEDGK